MIHFPPSDYRTGAYQIGRSPNIDKRISARILRDLKAALQTLVEKNKRTAAEVLVELYLDSQIQSSRSRNFIVEMLSSIELDEEKVKTRWKAFLAHEAEIMKSLDLRGDRMH